jgi:hypothetical protein
MTTVAFQGQGGGLAGELLSRSRPFVASLGDLGT